MSDKNIKENRLYELRGSGYEMLDGEPDIRGWIVRNLQGQAIGKINELLFDPQSGKVRYLIVHIKGKALNIISRTVIIPIGLAELHEENDDVILPNVTVGHLASLPDYKKGNVTAAEESSIRNVFANTALAANTNSTVNADDFYNHEHFEDDKMYNRRKPNLENETVIPVIKENVNIGKSILETGRVRVKKNIVEEPVEETVQLKEQHVTVERHPVDKPVQEGSFAPFQEGTIELIEHREIPVVSKEAKVVEEVFVGKDVKQRDETVRDTVRRTEVDIEELNKSNRSETITRKEI